MTAEEELAGIVARMQAAAAAADDGAVAADAALPLRCSFCVKDRGACKRLISGPGNIYICDECVELCSDICGQPEEEEAPQAEELLALRARVTELEAERDRMLPIYTAHLEQERCAHDRAQQLAALSEHRLHCAQHHPDYEYATTLVERGGLRALENARKCGESPMPQGEGWEPNDIVLITNGIYGADDPPRYRNWERFDLTETNYWRRRKLAEEPSCAR